MPILTELMWQNYINVGDFGEFLDILPSCSYYWKNSVQHSKHTDVQRCNTNIKTKAKSGCLVWHWHGSVTGRLFKPKGKTWLFNGHLSGTTRVQVKPIWTLLKQETMSGSGIRWAICKSAPRSRQIPHQHPTAVFTGWMPFLPPNQQRQSTEGSKYLLQAVKKLTVQLGWWGHL